MEYNVKIYDRAFDCVIEVDPNMPVWLEQELKKAVENYNRLKQECGND